MTAAAFLVWAAMAQMLLTFVVYLVLGRRRFGAMHRGEARPSEFLFGGGGPEAAQLAARNVANQFELPVLFYLLVVLALILDAAGWLLAVLAWAFVLSRVVHAYGHLQNILLLRVGSFFVGFGLAFAMWLVLGVQLLA